MSAPSQPCLIGLSTYRQTTSWWSWEECDAALVPGTYLDMVDAAGAQAVLLPPSGSGGRGGPSAPDRGVQEDQRRRLSVLDGLVLIGGGDLVAERYGQVADLRNAGVSDCRDQLEYGLLDEALRIDLPVLAICRGMQLLNVYCGGDLIQELADRLGSNTHRPKPGGFGEVSVVTEPESVVGRLYGPKATVLCSHHQAVSTVGEGLVVTARSEDGVIEAVELEGHGFVVGVQWHPEESGDVRLFEALVTAARSRPVIDRSGAPAGAARG